MVKPSNPSTILALDVGAARIGVAVASLIARLPRPLDVLQRTDSVFEDIARIAAEERAQSTVIGLPRNQQGEETAQSREVRNFAEQLHHKTGLEIIFADESLSSVRAEQTARTDKKLTGKYLDSIAACYILEEFLEASNQNKGTSS